VEHSEGGDNSHWMNIERERQVITALTLIQGGEGGLLNLRLKERSLFPMLEGCVRRKTTREAEKILRFSQNEDVKDNARVSFFFRRRYAQKGTEILKARGGGKTEATRGNTPKAKDGKSLKDSGGFYRSIVALGERL